MPRPRSRTDADLLAAAARAVTSHGLPGLTLAAVATEAGVSPASLVQRFGSKRGLLLALAEQSAADARRPFEQARAAPYSPLHALRAVLTVLPDATDREQLANHLTFLHADLTDPRFHACAKRHAEAVREEIARLLREAVDAGELVNGVDIDRLARVVRAAYNGSMIQWALTGEGTLAEAIATDLDTLLHPYRRDQG